MQTGLIESWADDPTSMGALYPFVGSEVFWVILGVVVWLAWTVWQLQHEKAAYQEEVAALKKGKKLEEALDEYQVPPHPYFTE